MQATRRCWTAAAMGGFLAVAAVVFARPALLGGAAGVGAWLLARQYQFLREVRALDRRLDVDQSVAPGTVATDEPATVTLSADLGGTTPLAVTVESTPPVAARGSTSADRRIRLDGEAGEQRTTYAVELPVAGVHTVGEPTVEVTGESALFVETLTAGPSESLTVEPRAPRNVHVGQGGELTAFGEHRGDRFGTGIEAAELREYVVGDATNRIDWKATARLNEPYVREFEAETDRRTVLVVDRRAGMADGSEGETKLDFAREVGLAFLGSARELDDPLGLYTVGEAGIADRLRPAAGPEQYATIRRRLEALTATAGNSKSRTRGELARSPADARTAAATLDGEDAFARTLRPFYAGSAAYVERIESDPLFGTVRDALNRLRGSVWTVVLTDDSRRRELREAVKLARRGDDHVLVFLTPDVLFEPGGLADLEAAYERYLAFEEFRRSLGSMARVEAFEVAPGDRVGALLARRRRDRGRQREVTR